jgi:hypothetical protein
MTGCAGGHGQVTGQTDSGGLDARSQNQGATNTGESGTGAKTPQPDIQAQGLSDFYAQFETQRAIFASDMQNALEDVGFQTNDDNTVLPRDFFVRGEPFFGIFSHYNQGEEALSRYMTQQISGNNTVKVSQEEGSFGLLPQGEKGIEFTLYARTGPNDELLSTWQGYWIEETQHLYCRYTDANRYALEIEIIKTEYGSVYTLYEIGDGLLFRTSLTDDYSWDGCAGYEVDAPPPPPLTGGEGLDFASSAVGEIAAYVLIEGATVTIKPAVEHSEVYVTDGIPGR